MQCESAALLREARDKGGFGGIDQGLGEDGLTPRAVLDKMACIQMLDVYFPTTDGRKLIFRRYTQPEKDQRMILEQLRWELPQQPPPRITAKGEMMKE